MDIYDWQNSLWKHIEKHLYVPQKPLYLSFHEEILDEIYSSATQSTAVIEGKAVQNFAQECNHFLTLYCNSIVLDPIIWNPDDRGLSLAICYAVQQILAVEDMEARSFYEPYIELMGASDKIYPECLHKNPLDDNFEKIWRTVNAELQIYLGCEQSQITFKQGRGKNKFRNYPFSQSLLSERELNALSEHFPQRRSKTEENARRWILRRESCLTNRSKKKLSSDEFVDRISHQFVVYLKHDTHPGIQKPEPKYNATTKYIFEIICITEGFEPDSYELLSKDQNSKAQVVTSFDQLENSFSNGFSLFLSTNAGYWESSSFSGKNIADFRSMILGIDLNASTGLAESIASELGVESVCIELSNSLLEAEHIEFHEFPFYGIKNKEKSIDEVFSKVLSGLSNRVVGKITLEGGLVVDSRKKKYMINYPPTELIFSGHKLSPSEVIQVNEKKMIVGDFLATLVNVRNECNFRISYENSHITFGFEGTKFDLQIETSANWIVDDRLILSKDILTEDIATLECEPYFSHFSVFNYTFGSVIQVDSESLLKYSLILPEFWVPFPYDNQNHDALSDALRKSELSYWLQEFLEKIILTKQIPYPLLLDMVRDQD